MKYRISTQKEFEYAINKQASVNLILEEPLQQWECSRSVQLIYDV